MKISSYTPKLTVDEAQRCWMTPIEVCDLAAIGDASDPKVKKLLNTLSDRNHLPFVKSGEARTAPRLYSLVSAAMLRVFFDITRDGRTYKYAEPVARYIAEIMVEAVEKCSTLADVDHTIGDLTVFFADVREDGTPLSIGAGVGVGLGLLRSTYDAGYLVFKLLNIYPDLWHGDLVKRGEIEPDEPDMSDRFDSEGRPIWGRD